MVCNDVLMIENNFAIQTNVSYLDLFENKKKNKIISPNTVSKSVVKKIFCSI